MNPQMLIKLIQGGQNPEQLVMYILENQMGGNPMGQNLLALARNHDRVGLEQIARNLAKERGVDFDKEFLALQSLLGPGK